MKVFVGLDCGGSSSRVMAVDALGTVLFQGHSGAANLVSTPDNRLKRNLVHATNGCPAPTHVCGCFAGLVNEEVRQRGLDVLRGLFPAAALRAEPDYTAAFYASPPQTDICVIAGTGSLVCSRGPEGMIKSGGRGYILGDHGSAYQYGRDALIHFLEKPDARTETLTRAVRDVFESEAEGPIVAAVYRAPTPATALAKLAKALGLDARAGEGYAVESVRRNAGRLADIVADHVHRHLPDRRQVGICLAGGVWKAAPIFREAIASCLQDRMPEVEITVTRITRPPLHGAVELAKEIGTRKIHGN